MPRILCGAMVGWLVLSTTQVAAQQPGRGASVPGSTVTRATPTRVAVPNLLPGTPSDVFSTIQGKAVTSTNESLPDAFVRLRDARIGQIVEVQLTDQDGLFAFQPVDPGSYIVEIIDRDQRSVLAASQVLNIGPGEAASAVVKLPFKIPLLAGVLGNTPSSAALVTTQAAVAGVLAAQVSGAPTCNVPE